MQNFLSNRSVHNTGEIVCGRYVRDLPNHKLARLENTSKCGFCLPENFLEEIHKLLVKKKHKNNEKLIETAVKGTMLL